MEILSLKQNTKSAMTEIGGTTTDAIKTARSKKDGSAIQLDAGSHVGMAILISERNVMTKTKDYLMGALVAKKTMAMNASI